MDFWKFWQVFFVGLEFPNPNGINFTPKPCLSFFFSCFFCSPCTFPKLSFAIIPPGFQSCFIPFTVVYFESVSGSGALRILIPFFLYFRPRKFEFTSKVSPKSCSQLNEFKIHCKGYRRCTEAFLVFFPSRRFSSCPLKKCTFRWSETQSITFDSIQQWRRGLKAPVFNFFSCSNPICFF